MLGLDRLAGLRGGADSLAQRAGRERELVDQLVAGHDTREVAQRMFLAENTVQDHLKSIFAKTATRNRRTLLSRALGSRSARPQQVKTAVNVSASLTPSTLHRDSGGA